MHAKQTPTHYIRGLWSANVSALSQLFQPRDNSDRSQIPAQVCGASTFVCVRGQTARDPPVLLPLRAPTFSFYFQRKPLCESLRVCVCVPSFLRASPHKRTQKPGTMQRALAEETDFCPTPTNRKLLLHPPHPAFVSHADTHTRVHADGKRNHAVPEY